MQTNKQDFVIPVESQLSNSKDYCDSDSNFPEANNGFGYTIFLRVCLNVGYLFGIFPFRIKSDGTIAKNKIHTVICGIGHLLTSYNYLTAIRKFPFQTLKGNVVHYFLFFQKVATFIFKLSVMKILWFDQSKFQKIDTFLCNSKHFAVSKSKLTSKIIISTICITYILLGLGSYIFGVHIVAGLSYDNLTWFYRRYVADARYAFFISNNLNVSTTPEIKDIGIGDNIAVAVMLFGNYCRSLMGFYCDSIILMASLTLWLPSKAFSNEVKIQIQLIHENYEGNGKLNRIFEEPLTSTVSKYNTLKELAMLINNTLQWVVFAYMMESVVYYSIYIDAIFVAPDWFRRLRLGIVLIGVFIIFTIASDIVRQVEVVGSWISHEEISKIVPHMKTTILFDQLSTKPISISGGVFTLTYSLVGVIATTLVTYFIMCSSIDANYT